ncbi:hypothetical protein [Citrobacter portucalensis]|uniref:hypothetical protein n=1 Tax=Citrobacter portucalensis TaxID=1639133 RepID=UPI00339D463B
MTALNKKALREELEVCSKDRMRMMALALLDELEAKDATIAFQQHEIRTLLGRLENANRAAAAWKGATS